MEKNRRKAKIDKAAIFNKNIDMSENSAKSQWAWPKEGAHNDHKPVDRVELRVRGWASSSERESLT